MKHGHLAWFKYMGNTIPHGPSTIPQRQNTTTRLITQTNTGGSLRLALNWLSSLHKINIANRAHIYCTDDSAHQQVKEYCKKEEIPANYSRTHLNSFNSVPDGNHPYGTRTFIRFTLWKLDLLAQLSTAKTFDPFLFCDPDVVILRDPEPIFHNEVENHPGQHLWFSSDRADNKIPQTTQGEYSTGVIFQTKREAFFWSSSYEWLFSRMETTTDVDGPHFVHDQTAANAILELFARVPGRLPTEFFRNGAQPWTGDPVLIHSNWVVGNDTKENRFRKAALWFANDESLSEIGL